MADPIRAQKRKTIMFKVLRTLVEPPASLKEIKDEIKDFSDFAKSLLAIVITAILIIFIFLPVRAVIAATWLFPLIMTKRYK